MKASRKRHKEKQHRKHERIAARKHAQGIADRLLGHVTLIRREWMPRIDPGMIIRWKGIE